MKVHRTLARELAFNILYAWDINSGEPISIGEDVLNVMNLDIKKDAKKYTFLIVKHFSENIDSIDKEISSKLENWTLEDIGKIEKAILRVSFTELLYLKPKKTIQALIEYMNIANKYGNKKTPAFINGVLSQVIKNE